RSRSAASHLLVVTPPACETVEQGGKSAGTVLHPGKARIIGSFLEPGNPRNTATLANCKGSEHSSGCDRPARGGQPRRRAVLNLSSCYINHAVTFGATPP